MARSDSRSFLFSQEDLQANYTKGGARRPQWINWSNAPKRASSGTSGGGTSMSEEINEPRRRLLGATALGFVAAQLGATASAFAQDNAPGREITSTGSFGPLKRVDAGVLSIAYAEAGPADGPPVLLLHGWPYDIHSFVDVAPVLAAAGYRVLVPYLRGYGPTHFLSSNTPR